MILPTPRIIAIDDNPKHLEVLVQGLNQCGTACLPIHFEGEEKSITPCPHVRVIFADLHLTGGLPGDEDHDKVFSVIGGLIQENIKPSGPYFIVLWTQYSDQADKLRHHLIERLENVAKPFTVEALDKKDYLNLTSGDVENLEKLVKAIRKSVEDHPQFGALLNWEERVLDGAADTLSSITEMVHGPDKTDATTQETRQASALDPAEPSKALGRLLRILAEGAVGRSHVEDDRFRAVNDALLPILADRIASMRSREVDDALWQQALGGPNVQSQPSLSNEEAARLNQLLHIEPLSTDENQVKRGSVIDLPHEFLDKSFLNVFDINSKTAMKEQFCCKQSGDDASKSCDWVLVQTQAACDYAQNQPGPLPFHLGLLMPKSSVNRNKKPPAAVWCSPYFEHKQQIKCLHVSARFPVSLSREKTSQTPPLFRLREQLLNNLIYHLHGYGARPGFISFR